MVDSGNNLIGFLGVSAGKLEAFLIGVDGAVRKAVSALAGLYFCLTYFRFSTLDKDDIYRNTASSLRFLLVKGFTEVIEMSPYKPAQLMCDH